MSDTITNQNNAEVPTPFDQTEGTNRNDFYIETASDKQEANFQEVYKVSETAGEYIEALRSRSLEGDQQ